MAVWVTSIMLALWGWPGVVIGTLAVTVLVEWLSNRGPICSTKVKVIVAILAVGLGVFLSGP